MDPKDLQKAFRAAAWPNPSAMEVFLMAADVVPAVELLKLLPLLTDKTAVGEPSHRLRCQAFKRLVENSPDPQLFVPIVKAVKIADSTARASLCEALPKVNSVAGHHELAQLLKLPEAAIRKSVAGVLKAIAGKSVFDAVCAVAREDHPGRNEAIELATGIGGYHAIPLLESVLLNGKPDQRVVAAKMLGDPRQMGKDLPGALNALGRVLSDATQDVAVAATTSFAALCTEEQFHERLGGHFDSNNLSFVKAVVDAARRFSSAQTMDALERRFRIGPNAIRMLILNTLEVMGNDATLPLLTDALNHKQIGVRNRAAEVLSNLAIAKKVNLARTIMWLLRSRDVNVRRVAVDLARKVGDPTGEVWPSLLRLLRDEDWWVRERVMDALVEMAGTQLTRHIVGYLQDPNDVVRRYAVDVLLRLKDPQALGALVRTAQGDGDWWVRERAIEAVGATKDQRAIPYVVDMMQKEPALRIACLEALATLQAKPAAVQVAAMLGSEEADVRWQALACLEVVGDRSQAQAVAGLSGDLDHRVRMKARALLARWAIAIPESALTSGAGALTPLDRLLIELARVEGDDLLLGAGRPPYVKKHGKVIPLEGMQPIGPDAMNDLLAPHLTEVQLSSLENKRDVDFSYEVKSEALRFRANVFRQNTGLSAVFRIVKDQLLTVEQLGLPASVRGFGELKNGLVLVGGPTGSGKSTTLAALIDQINRTSDRHIITLEDPIEAVHTRKRSLINQREIGTHTRSFAAALRSVLREDPDVLLVGEMRDLATISFAVTAAETGHLVFGTLHTVSADNTVDRLINAFPAGQQAQVRSMLAESLRAVVCQHLLKRKDRPGRVLAVEVMVNNDAVSNLVRKGKAFQLPSIIATSKEQGMQTMDSDLRRLVRDGIVDADEAYMKAASKKEFEEFLTAQREAEKKAVPAKPGPSVPPPARPPTVMTPVVKPPAR